MPEMIPVESSNIAEVGYDEAKQVLVVTFHGGRSYSYDGVKPDTYQDFIKAGSKGKFFAQSVKGCYNFKRL